MIRKTNARIAACYSLTCHAKKKVACTCGEVFKCLSMYIYIYRSLCLEKSVPWPFFWVYIIVLYNYMLVFLQCKILSKIIRKEFGTFVSVAGSSSILWKKWLQQGHKLLPRNNYETWSAIFASWTCSLGNSLFWFFGLCFQNRCEKQRQRQFLKVLPSFEQVAFFFVVVLVT